MPTPFAAAALGQPRPGSLRGEDAPVLPRRVATHPSPASWRDEVLYFLLVDRFSDGAEEGRPLLDRANRGAFRPAGWLWDAWARSGRERWQGGTLAGVRSKLDYLQELGVTALWLSPMFRQRGHLDTYHGYGVQDFLDVDPRFGTRADLVALVDAAHARGLRIILDVIFNHSGSNWRYPATIPGEANDGDTVPYTTGRHSFGNWTNGAGGRAVAIAGPDDGVWPVELQDPDAYTRAGSGSLGAGDPGDDRAEHKRSDFVNLRDVDLDHPARGGNVLDLLAGCCKYWIALTDCDGFRIDTMKHVTFEQARNFCGAIKEFAANIGKQNFALFAEVAGGDDVADRYLDAVGRNLDAALDIGGMRPTLVGVAKGLVAPAAYFDRFDPRRTDDLGSHRILGDKHVSILDDHDQIAGEKLRFGAGAATERQAVAGVALQLMTLGIPCVYYGTEQGFAGPEPSEQRWLPDWGGSDVYLREAMFGPARPRPAGRAGLVAGATDPVLPGFGPFGTAGAHVFDPDHPAYRRIAALCRLRRNTAALRHGRQYQRPLSLFGGPFALPGAGELIAWSRVLDDEEALCVVNGHGTEARGGEVLVDAALNPPGSAMRVVLNSAEAGGGTGTTAPVGSDVPVRRRSDGTAFVSLRDLPPSEVLVLQNRA